MYNTLYFAIYYYNYYIVTVTNL